MLNGEPLEEVDCVKNQGSQVAADVECERMWDTEEMSIERGEC